MSPRKLADLHPVSTSCIKVIRVQRISLELFSSWGFSLQILGRWVFRWNLGFFVGTKRGFSLEKGVFRRKSMGFFVGKIFVF